MRPRRQRRTPWRRPPRRRPTTTTDDAPPTIDTDAGMLTLDAVKVVIDALESHDAVEFVDGIVGGDSTVGFDFTNHLGEDVYAEIDLTVWLL